MTSFCERSGAACELHGLQCDKCSTIPFLSGQDIRGSGLTGRGGGSWQLFIIHALLQQIASTSAYGSTPFAVGTPRVPVRSSIEPARIQLKEIGTALATVRAQVRAAALARLDYVLCQLASGSRIGMIWTQ